MTDPAQIKRLSELYALGAISRRTLIEAAGLNDVIKDDEDNNVADEVENLDEEDILDRTFPLGTLLRPKETVSIRNLKTALTIPLASRPGGRPIEHSRADPSFENYEAQDYWTVVDHRSGWTKIVALGGVHMGWTFYVRDYFERV